MGKLKEQTNYINPYSDRTQPKEETSESPKVQPKRSVQRPLHSYEQEQSLSPARQVQAARKERMRSESMVSPKGEDLTVTSGDPTAHLNRRHSVGKVRSKRSSSSASNSSKDAIDFQKSSPTNRLHQRETEFSAIEKPACPAAERLEPHALNNAINENRPKPVPFDRYQPTSGSYETLNVHSRQGSSELLDVDEGSSFVITSASQYRERRSPTPTRDSSRLSPVANRSVRSSLGRLV